MKKKQKISKASYKEIRKSEIRRHLQLGLQETQKNPGM